MPRSFCLRMRSVSDKSCRDNQNIHFVSSNFFFFSCAIYEIMWKNVVERGQPQMTIRRICIVFWIIKSTHMLILCNTDCFLSAPMVARMRFSVTFICTLPVLFTVNSMHVLVCYTYYWICLCLCHRGLYCW